MSKDPCEELDGLLCQYVCEILVGEPLERIQEHLKVCTGCQELLTYLQEGRAADYAADPEWAALVAKDRQGVIATRKSKLN
ncbi:MAG: hypothetical protein AB203_03695 [Parcubacteria bacterium C7867-008]|nr:MAG: hypothetical protein AB203_03695 [Parcubacteria bacterium C7867-008]